MEWDAIPYDQLVFTGEKLGAGSFGVVMKGLYLGVEVAIKEVLPSTDYEVSKYFEREWRIMKEARHPNVVLYLGLSRAPPPDGRIFIISEFIDNGNLRSYIWDTRSHPTFPWRLRLSFATDIARALAYLHARKCIHRDLKGENLLITSNERIKMTDFGFARIAARNEEEMRRMSYCGTDGYMSPEILMGLEFDLPTDVFSLGIIFAEIISRKLVDSNTFKRSIPTFGLDVNEVRNLASPGCPPGFIQLTLDCALVDPAFRPQMPEVLRRLRELELEVLARGDANEHVGSLKLVGGPSSRPGLANKRIPSFGQGVGKDIRSAAEDDKKKVMDDSTDDEQDDEDLHEILKGLGTVKLAAGHGKAAAEAAAGEEEKNAASVTWRTARWGDSHVDASKEHNMRGGLPSFYEDASEMRGHQHLLSETTTYAPSTNNSVPSTTSRYSTTVVRSRPNSIAALPDHEADEGGASSVLTIKNTKEAAQPATPPPVSDLPDIPSEVASPTAATSISATEDPTAVETSVEPAAPDSVIARPTPASAATDESIPIPATTITSPDKPTRAPPAVPASAYTHRFSFVKPVGAVGKGAAKTTGGIGLGWFYGAASSVGAAADKASSTGGEKTRCSVCKHRVKNTAPFLCCDDCKRIVHVKCSANAPRDCGKPSTASPPPAGRKQK